MVSYCATLTLVLQMPSYNVSGYTKRVTGSAFVFLGYCIGNIIGPHPFIASEAPEYPTGCKTLIACNTFQLGLIGCLWLLLKTRNKRRDAAQAGMRTEEMPAEERPLEDITDFEVGDTGRFAVVTANRKGRTQTSDTSTESMEFGAHLETGTFQYATTRRLLPVCTQFDERGLMGGIDRTSF